MKNCVFNNCQGNHEAKGYCNKHYLRYRKYGDPGATKVIRIEGDFATYFWSQLDKSSDCWVWIGKSFRGGYGRVSYCSKATDAHRVAYMLTNGEIPKGRLVLHSCDNPPCCNPNHLRLGNHKDNATDRENRKRVVRRLKGSLNHQAVLNENFVREIRNSHLTSVELAKIYGVTANCIRTIIRYKSWRHV